MHIVAYEIAYTRIEPGKRERDWMNQTQDKFAYLCLPLVLANEFGWTLHCNQDSAAELDDDGNCWCEGQPVQHFGPGIITWHIPTIFRTDPGWNLYVKGPTNYPKQGIYYLEALVESDWAVATFTYNMLVTEKQRRIEWKAGEPIAQVFPIPTGVVESTQGWVLPIEANENLAREYKAWAESRTRHNANGVGRQRHYSRGTSPLGYSPPPGFHRNRISMAEFLRKNT